MSSIGTGLDVVGIVDSLMAVQQRDLDQLNYEKAFYQNQQKAYTQFQGNLSQFNSTLKNLQAVFDNQLYTIQSSNEGIVSAVTSGQDTAPGTYNITVQQLAQSQQIVSGPVLNNNQALGIVDTLTVGVGANSFTLNVSETDTLESIRDNINNSLNNPGITASILKSTDGSGNTQYQLLLTSTNTGLENAMTLSGGLVNDLNLNTQLTAAQDALFTINGFNEQSSSNLISDVLDGVVLHLNGQTGSANLMITPDVQNQEAAISTALQTMVDSYNNLMDVLANNQSLNSLRDNTYMLIQMNLENAIGQEIGNSSVTCLSDLGIYLAYPERVTNEEGVEYVVGGKLKIDNAKLYDMLNNNMSDLETFFTNSSNGLITSLENSVSDIQIETISSRVSIINQQTSYTNQRIGREEVRLDEMRDNLIKQYAELDAFLNRYNQMADFLTMQFDSMLAFSINNND